MKRLITLLLLSVAILQSSSQNPVRYDYNNKFALDFYRSISKTEKGNIFFSPISISSAMGMAYAGAKNNTESQIAQVFNFSNNSKAFHDKHGKLAKLINQNKNDVEVSMVNKLWVEKTFNLKKSYKKLLRNSYQSSFQAVDFVKKYEQSRLLINDYILKQTHDRIKDLLPPNSLDTRTRLVLTNAIYFKAKWEIPFEKSKTRNGDFYITPTETVECPMMNVKDDFNYFEDTKYEALELTYKDTCYSLFIFLPASGESLEEFESSFSPEKLTSIRGAMAYEQLKVTIPRFQFSEGYQLKKNLIEMGMPEPFSMKADFSGIAGKNDLQITDVFHQAFVDMSEEGTEAAAATAIVVGVKSIGRDKFFVANRPFVFLILEKKTNTILFIGRMSNPTKK